MSNLTPSERSSQYSASPASSPLPGWAPPRSPLPPHRLAKLANALGVSTPLPAMQPSPSFLSVSSSFPSSSTSASFSDQYRRSPTPSSMSTSAFSSSTYTSQSKFLLHVIPPHHLPHDSDDSPSTSELTPPPLSASGYHTQFQRGTLVALQSSLHAQLTAIAKEYALPSTAGLILYLVSSSHPSRSTQNSPMPFQSPASNESGAEEPGPRLSEDIWKFIWSRVVQTEREEAIARSRGPTPSPFGLGVGLDANSLRPLVSQRSETPQPFGYPITPSPSTPSSLSELRSHSKSAPPSSSTSASQFEPDTPDTSQSSDTDPLAQGIDLPGLNSPSIIPILAKVEFDIDRRRAPWYEPWLRSRRMNHAKRTESRMSNRKRAHSRAEGEESPMEDRRAPLDLKLVGRLQTASPAPSFALRNTKLAKDKAAAESSDEEAGEIGNYTPLSGSQEDLASGSEYEEESTARMASLPGGKDPLADMFGSDAETWASVHNNSQGVRRQPNPNVVELALDGSTLAALPDQRRLDEAELEGHDEVEEVRDILHRMSRPSLMVSIPASSPPNKRRSSPTTAGTIRRPVPPPLVLHPNAGDGLLVPATPSPAPPSSSTGSTDLAYLVGGSTPDLSDKDALSANGGEGELVRARSPADEKRDGAVFEDLDLGLEPSYEEENYDENDPNDRRRSQYLMKRKLDEIEKTLAQFSPRRLKTDLGGENHSHSHVYSTSSSAHTASSPPSAAFPPTPDSDFGSSRDNRDTVRYEGSSIIPQDMSNMAWPAVPFSSISAKVSNSPSPPRAPKAYMSNMRSNSSDTASSETELRKRDLDDSMYPPLLPPSFSRKVSDLSASPIPLSPDPFGRFSSAPEPEHGRAYWDPTMVQYSSEDFSEPRPSLSSIDEGSCVSTPPSSRFSADSATMSGEDVATTKSLKVSSNSRMSVKTFKKLWRKSKPSISGQPPTPVVARSSFQLPASARSSISQEQQVATPVDKSLPPIPIVATGSHGKLKTPVLADQESPYTVNNRSGPRPSISEPPNQPVSLPTPGGVPVTQPEKTAARKSILKSWKSASGLSQSSASVEQRMSIDRTTLYSDGSKPRRPSVLEMSSSGRRISSAGQSEIPPSPRLPEQYVASNAHARGNSGAFGHERRKSALRPKLVSASSSSAEASPPPRTSSLAMLQGSASPPRSILSTTSRLSEETRGSFDTSQFEMVSPPKVHPNVNYTYHGFEHD